MIGIVGGGITGLTIAHYLTEAGVEHVVFEAADRPGGVIRTLHAEGRVLECGPQRTRLTPGIRNLVDALDLRQELVRSTGGLPLFVYRDGRLRVAPFSVRALVRTDLLSRRGKARLLLEPFTAALREDETVAGFLTRKLGPEAYRYLVGPLYGGLYASEPENMLVRHSLARALTELGVSRSLVLAVLRRALAGGELPAACSFRNGLATLTDALHARHASRIRLNAPVLAVHHADATYVLETPHGEYRADAVILTSPADATAELIAGVAPDAAGRLAKLNYNPLAVVHMEGPEDLVGMGYQVPAVEGLETRGVTWNASMFDRPRLYTAYLGGAANPGMVERPDDEIAAIACEEFERVTGRPAAPLHVTRVRMPAWDRSWTALDGITLPPGLHLCANYESRAGVPGRIARARALAQMLA